MFLRCYYFPQVTMTFVSVWRRQSVMSILTGFISCGGTPKSWNNNGITFYFQTLLRIWGFGLWIQLKRQWTNTVCSASVTVCDNRSTGARRRAQRRQIHISGYNKIIVKSIELLLIFVMLLLLKSVVDIRISFGFQERCTVLLWDNYVYIWLIDAVCLNLYL